MKKSEKLNFRFNVINLILVIISLGIGFYAIKSNEDIAIRSGAFDKGEIGFEFGGYSIFPEKNYEVFYGINFEDSTFQIAKLPVTVKNIGKKTLKNVKLYYQYPTAAHLAIKDSILDINAPFIEKFKRSYQKNSSFENTQYQLNSINPNNSINSGDVIFLRNETIIDTTLSVVTKDSISLKMNAKVAYSIPITIAITANDTKKEDYSFSLNFRNETNLNRLANRIIKEKMEEENNPDLKKGFFVTIPEPDNSNLTGNLSLLESTNSNTLFIQFDNSMTTIRIIRPDGIYSEYEAAANNG